MDTYLLEPLQDRDNYLSPQQIPEMVEKQLPGFGMHPKASCSKAFFNSLRKFFQVQRDKLERKIKFVKDIGGNEKSKILEKVSIKHLVSLKSSWR